MRRPAIQDADRGDRGAASTAVTRPRHPEIECLPSTSARVAFGKRRTYLGQDVIGCTDVAANDERSRLFKRLPYFSPPGTSPTPVQPELSTKHERVAGKERSVRATQMRSMLSRPATGITSIDLDDRGSGRVALEDNPGCHSAVLPDALSIRRPDAASAPGRRIQSLQGFVVLAENARRLFGILSEERSAERGTANGNKLRRSSRNAATASANALQNRQYRRRSPGVFFLSSPASAPARGRNPYSAVLDGSQSMDPAFAGMTCLCARQPQQTPPSSRPSERQRARAGVR